MTCESAPGFLRIHMTDFWWCMTTSPVPPGGEKAFKDCIFQAEA